MIAGADVSTLTLTLSGGTLAALVAHGLGVFKSLGRVEAKLDALGERVKRIETVQDRVQHGS